jgi:Kdo2-lipid IVA lauroyltransferase/acyltransferase
MQEASISQKNLSKNTGTVDNGMADAVTARLVRCLAWLLGYAPDIVIDWLGRALAVLFYDVLRVRRRLVLSNIRRMEQDPKRANEIARASYYHFSLTMLEFLASWRRDIAGNIKIENRQFMDEALKGGKGAVILVGHIGSWEAFGPAASRYVAPAHVIVKAVGGPKMTKFVEENRHRNGFLSLVRPAKGEGYKAIVRALNRNETVGFVIDQARPDAQIDFFGEPAPTNTSLAAIMQRNPVPVIPGSIRRTGVFAHTVSFCPPVAYEPTEDLVTMTKKFNQALEIMIRRNPEQYFWFHNRWKKFRAKH